MTMKACALRIVNYKMYVQKLCFTPVYFFYEVYA